MLKELAVDAGAGNAASIVGNSSVLGDAEGEDGVGDGAKAVARDRRPLLGRLAANAKGTSRAAASSGLTGAQHASKQGAAAAAAVAPLRPLKESGGVLGSELWCLLPLRGGASSSVGL